MDEEGDIGTFHSLYSTFLVCMVLCSQGVCVCVCVCACLFWNVKYMEVQVEHDGAQIDQK